ncbi:hypothetical protein [Thermaerobacillus caldiproteolyticus]|uniref:hypothetical protein n=1 Tax=Thermaerobacillus caldiproteolyticus TaxID=247480 RepID=UPI0018F15E07|nr:hypothetical protein [Anoxybacillus caldiproteolyticus]
MKRKLINSLLVASLFFGAVAMPAYAKTKAYAGGIELLDSEGNFGYSLGCALYKLFKPKSNICKGN